MKTVAPAPMHAVKIPIIPAITAGFSNIPPDEVCAGCTITGGAVVVAGADM